MKQIVEFKEIINGTNLGENICDCQNYISKILDKVQNKQVINCGEYMVLNSIIKKVKSILIKIYKILDN